MNIPIRTTVYVAITVLFIATVVIYATRMPGIGEMKNAEMLDSGSNVPIVSETNVGYFQGASGYFVRPEAAPPTGGYPGVVMIHENRGLRPEIRATADQLAREGYMVLAVDLFGGKVVETQDEARALTAAFNQQTGVQNMRAAVAYLKNKGAAKIASLGWCFGGRQSVELAISGERFGATVVYYGGGMATSTERLAPIKWPVLGVFGDRDQVIPIEMVRAFETSLNTLGVENEIYIYPGVGHAFANPSGMNYAPDETKDAWKKTVDFLNRYLKSGNTVSSPSETAGIPTSADDAPPGSIHNLPVPPAVTAVRKLAAETLNISEGKVIIMTAFEKEWPDGCLGLASIGEFCTQVIIPGWEVTVQAGGKEYTYRTNSDGTNIRLEK